MARRRRTDEVGTPGAHASMLARRALASSAACALATLVTGGLAVWLVAASSYVLAAIPGVVAVLCALASRGFWHSANKALVGARSERTVGRALVAAGPHVVLHGLMLGAGGDLDHAVVGPVLAAVETKTGYGNVRVDSSGALWAGRRKLLGDPLAQCQRQAKALGKVAHMRAAAIVCVVNMENAAFTRNGVTVCSAKHLQAVLRDLPTVLDPAQAAALAAALVRKGDR